MYGNWSSQFRFISAVISVALLASCTRELTECGGPALDTSALAALKKATFASGTPANLVVPNPIDATNDRFATAGDSDVAGAAAMVGLPDLAGTFLDTSFLHVRLHSTDDAVSTLARPSGDGSFNYPVTSLHYGEVMGYYSVQAVLKYVEALGFRFVRSRPLYVLAHARDEAGKTPEEVNAYYEHNTLFPNRPRLMSLYGEGDFAPSADRDMFAHEMGHFMNESISREVGMDFAGENGAIYTEASAIHECMADYIAESLGNKNFIGKWINRNFEGTQAGEPLRWAIDRPGDVGSFAKVLAYDPNTLGPLRYSVAEVCTRALWAIRAQLLAEDPELGTFAADRMILSALTLVKKDTSMRDFHSALLASDEQLHCGLHSRSISKAFSDRGFESEVDTIGTPLTLAYQAVSLANTTTGAARGVGFALKVTNPGGVTARNVRVVLETLSANFEPVIYSQGYGDLAGGKSITISTANVGFSVQGNADFSSSSTARFRLSVVMDNGSSVVKTGEVKR